MKGKTMIRYWMLLVLLCIALPVRAALNIDIFGAGENQIPVAIVPFDNEGKLAQRITEIVSADLKSSGHFKIAVPTSKTPHEPHEIDFADWRGVEAMAIGSVEMLPDGRVTVKFRLFDAVKQTELFGQAVTAKADQVRAIGHRIADLIYEKLTGNPGVFSTRIAYVSRQGKTNRLVVADSDGFNDRPVLSINEPIMSPAWSPDGNQLAYVTLEKGHAVVYVQSLLTNQRRVLSDARGSNSAPAWSPDGRQLAIVLTRDGSPQIYLIRADGSDLRRITFSGAIDTEPSFSPDGQHLLFTSDRGGSPQIYRVSVDGKNTERLTFEGGHNFSPRYSPDGKSFVFAHQKDGRFHVAVQDFQTRQMQLLTSGGWDKRPSFSPNGKLILFATESGRRGILTAISSDGRVRTKKNLSSQSGDIREPVWGPFLR